MLMLGLLHRFQPYLPHKLWKRWILEYLTGLTVFILTANMLAEVVEITPEPVPGALKLCALGSAYITFVLCMAAFVYLVYVYLSSMISGAASEQAKLCVAAEAECVTSLTAPSEVAVHPPPPTQVTTGTVGDFTEQTHSGSPGSTTVAVKRPSFYYVWTGGATVHGPYTLQQVLYWGGQGYLSCNSMVGQYNYDTGTIPQYKPMYELFERLLPALFHVMV